MNYVPGLVLKAGAYSEKKTESLSSQSTESGGTDGLIADAGTKGQLSVLQGSARSCER